MAPSVRLLASMTLCFGEWLVQQTDGKGELKLLKVRLDIHP